MTAATRFARMTAWLLAHGVTRTDEISFLAGCVPLVCVSFGEFRRLCPKAREPDWDVPECPCCPATRQWAANLDGVRVIAWESAPIFAVHAPEFIPHLPGAAGGPNVGEA